MNEPSNLVEYVEALAEEDAGWLVDTPTETYSGTGVMCTVCSAVHPLRHHMPLGRFSHLCPACRRGESNRTAQVKRYYAVKAAIKEEELVRRKLNARAVRNVNSAIDQLQRVNRRQLARAQATADSTPTPRRRTLIVIDKRERLVSFYEAVRAEMLKDVELNQLQPIKYYLEDDHLYGKFFG